ncbi:four helix bundle protein [Patescibacteria group bacterium]|nr:four helix bundle protein [Patescibacteria group bacterium]MBU1613051.1 four helix bundle protein [Patescibacteria group bacterium]
MEGFARQGANEFRRFLIISFGSLEETRYLLEFSLIYSLLFTIYSFPYVQLQQRRARNSQILGRAQVF